MGIIPKFFLILSFFSQISFAALDVCQIKFYEKTYYIGEKNLLPPSELIESSSCPEDLQKKIIEIVLNSEGPLKASYLKEAAGISSINILPEKFEIVSLLNSIKIPPNWLWENFKIVSGQKTLHGNEISINCTSCTSLGKKVLEIKMGKTTLWANGDLKIMAPILISKFIIPSNKEILSQNDFEIVNKPIFNLDEYFVNLEEISFYKLNLDIPDGTPLKKSNLRKIDLIKPGTPANLILINNGIQIKGMGIPMSSGKIGEIVKVKNPKTNNILFGKVVGENTLSVNL
jgi:flagella basal body P-ring formation protein FlgA